MTRIEDFRTETGDINWDGYEAAEIARGTRCKECGSFMLGSIFSRSGPIGARECGSCQELRDSTEAWHDDDRVRCPVCRDVITISDTDYWDSGIYNDDQTTTVECYKCDYQYEVETTITYTFKSPAMKEGG